MTHSLQTVCKKLLTLLNYIIIIKIKISNEILIKRDYDFNRALNVTCKNDIVFFDRGVHEITAYLRSISKSTSYWEELTKIYKYDMVFIFPSWKDIYIKDNNRIN